jgi:hypothetical protein
MTTEQLRRINKIVKHYGAEHQMEKAIEECKELIEEIVPAIDGLGFVENIVDEIADVEVMINQLKIIFDCFGEVEERIEYKINRQLERMKSEV